MLSRIFSGRQNAGRRKRLAEQFRIYVSRADLFYCISSFFLYGGTWYVHASGIPLSRPPLPTSTSRFSERHADRSGTPLSNPQTSKKSSGPRSGTREGGRQCLV